MKTRRITPIISTNKQSLKPREVINLWSILGWCGKNDYSTRTIKAAINNTTFVVYAKNENQELIGLARVFSDQFLNTYIVDLLIHPDYQKLGIGKKLVQKIKEKFKHTVILLETFDRNRKFFRKCGFKEQKLLVFYNYE
jgi:ribosomal protein S18 acetylase RimI-like enzyme